MKTTNTFKKLMFTALFNLMILAYSLAQNSEFAVPLSDPNKRGKLKATINSGSITVKGTSRKDVLVRYTADDEDDENESNSKDHEKAKGKGKFRVKTDVNINFNDDDEDDSSLEGLRKVSGGGVDLEAVESDNTVRISSNAWHGNLNLIIEVPIGFDLQLETHNGGDLDINTIQGSLELTNHNGEITALNISGSVVANTYNGEIKVSFDKVTEGTPMSFLTYNGDIEAIFPGTIKNSFKVKTDQGDVYSNFDVNFKTNGPIQKQDTKAGVYKVVIDEWKHADINGGGAAVTMKTLNGNIIIRKK